MDKRQKVLLALAVAVVVMAALVLIVVLPTSRPAPSPPAAPPPPLPTTTTTAPPKPVQPGALVVKIDNVGQARPQSGLSNADVVYVEPVEGGLTRLAAVYLGALPETVGPVRSVRETDIELLAQYGRPVLAYSGAAPELLSLLAGAPVVNASPQEAGGAYFRDPRRIAPHDFYLRPGALPKAAPAEGFQPAMLFGPAPGGGLPTGAHNVGFAAASYGLVWSPPAGRWLISMDGRPLTSTEAGQLGAATVVVQRITTRPGRVAEDGAGSPSPVGVTVGGGAATVLRDGQVFEATWSRPGPNDPTRFALRDGTPLPLAQGPVWIMLVPV